MGFFSCALAGVRLLMAIALLLGQAEKQQTIPMRAGDDLGDGAKGPVSLTSMLKAIGEDLHLDLLASVFAGENSSGDGKAIVGTGGVQRLLDPPTANFAGLGNSGADVGVAS